jgi:hypothetical protein
MSLMITLNRLEAHLKTLVEGSLARFFPTYDPRRELAQRLCAALIQEARPDANGKVLAPDHFTIFLPPSQAAALSGNPDLLFELAQDLLLAAAQAGVVFSASPAVRILPDPDASLQISVLAQFTLPEAARITLGTTKLPSLPVPSAPTPNHSAQEEAEDSAFLLLENGHIFPLESAVTNLGRSPENHLFLPDERIEPLHAQIRLAQGRYRIFNLAEPGALRVNHLPRSSCDLQPGDVISLNGVLLVYGRETPLVSLDTTQPILET